MEFCDSNERSGPWITLPEAFSPATGATPESITATPTPLPVNPAFQYSSASADSFTMSIRLAISTPSKVPLSVTGLFSLTSVMPGTVRRNATSPAGTRAEKPPMMPSCCCTRPPSRSTSCSGPVPAPACLRTITEVSAPSPVAATAGAVATATSVASMATTASRRSGVSQTGCAPGRRVSVADPFMLRLRAWTSTGRGTGSPPRDISRQAAHWSPKEVVVPHPEGQGARSGHSAARTD